jgi:hypothetical protein
MIRSPYSVIWEPLTNISNLYPLSRDVLMIPVPRYYSDTVCDFTPSPRRKNRNMGKAVS